MVASKYELNAWGTVLSSEIGEISLNCTETGFFKTTFTSLTPIWAARANFSALAAYIGVNNVKVVLKNPVSPEYVQLSSKKSSKNHEQSFNMSEIL